LENWRTLQWSAWLWRLERYERPLRDEQLHLLLDEVARWRDEAATEALEHPA